MTRVLVIDLETIPDPDLSFRPPVDRPDAFPPPPFHQIVAFGALAWGNDGPTRIKCLGDGDERSALEAFARLLTRGTQLVTWNGARFDCPVIVARCFKHRIPLPEYFDGRGYRYRYTEEGHLDLKDQLSDFGSAERGASLDTWARMIGLPGKGDTDGAKVAELWAAGEYERVRRYCLDDVAQTARLWIEWQGLTGRWSLDTVALAVTKLDDFVREVAHRPGAAA